MSSFAFVQIVEQVYIYLSDDILAARRRRFVNYLKRAGEKLEDAAAMSDARFLELWNREASAANAEPTAERQQSRLHVLVAFGRVYEPAPVACRRYVVLAEFAYTVLSLAAKSVLCWVLYVNVLVEQNIKY